MRFRASKTGLRPPPTPSSFPIDRSKAIALSQFFGGVSVVSYMAFVLSQFCPQAKEKNMHV